MGSSDEEAEDIADPLNYTVTLTVQGDDEDLKKTLEKASSLVQDAERPVSGSLGLLAKARSDREQLIAALYSEARYDGVVEISIDGRSLDDLPPDAEFDRSGPVPVTITIDPGAVFTLGDISLKGDAADLAPAEFGLIPGGDAGSDAILKAEAEIVRRLKEDGRPLAAVTGREIVADHATATLDVTLDVAAGPIAGFGETTVTGTETMDPDFTGYVTGLKPGKTYSPQEMDDARDRLLALGVFSSVTVKEGDALDQNGAIPILVEVSERKLRYYGVGATVSNTEGLGLEGYWGHRNLFGRAETLRIEGSVGRIGDPDVEDVGKLNYNAAILFEKPGVIGPDSKFFSNSARSTSIRTPMTASRSRSAPAWHTSSPGRRARRPKCLSTTRTSRTFSIPWASAIFWSAFRCNMCSTIATTGSTRRRAFGRWPLRSRPMTFSPARPS